MQMKIRPKDFPFRINVNAIEDILFDKHNLRISVDRDGNDGQGQGRRNTIIAPNSVWFNIVISLEILVSQ